jgi:integrase
LAARRAEQVRTMTAIVAGVDAEVTQAQVAELVEQVAASGLARNRLVAHLQAHPGVLTAGGSAMPKNVATFIYAAIAAGITGLVSPSCALCGQPKTLFHTYGEDQRICQRCYMATHTGVCVGCGQDRPITGRDNDGNPRCKRCQRNAKQGSCADCGRTRPVGRSQTDGLYYCRSCRARRAPTELCCACGQDRRINARTPNGQPLCTTCYAKTYISANICDQCGQAGTMVTRAGGRGGHDKNLCRRCYQHPRRECGACGHTRRVSLAATDEHPDICPTCYQAPTIDCSVCGHSELGRRTTNDGQPLCFRCDATRKIDTALADQHGHMPAVLTPVREAIVATDRPRSILSNMTRNRTLRLLTDIARSRIELSHDALDQQPPGFGVNYLRSLLVATGVLPDRDEHLTRLQRFATELIDTIPDKQNRQLVGRYARWQLISEAKPDRHGRIRPTVAYRCRDEIRVAVRFLGHLSQHGQTVTSCDQPTLDAWLTATKDRAQARPFITWLQHNSQLADIALPERAQRPDPVRFSDTDQRWATVRRMLHDPNSATIEERAAACLVLLFAQPVAKIAQLTVDDVHTDQRGRTHLQLGPHQLHLPPPLDELITQLPVDKPFGTAATLADGRWLFPGKHAGRHVHPSSLTRRLNKLGIDTLANRNTALLHIATTTPPAVFANLLGVHINTATRWAGIASGQWMNYAAARQPRRP